MLVVVVAVVVILFFNLSGLFTLLVHRVHRVLLVLLVDDDDDDYVGNGVCPDIGHSISSNKHSQERERARERERERERETSHTLHTYHKIKLGSVGEMVVRIWCSCDFPARGMKFALINPIEFLDNARDALQGSVDRLPC